MEINATFLGQAVAFVIFVVACMKWVWPPLMNALEQRQKQIADGLASAEKAKKSLELAKSNAADALRDAKAEAQKIIEDANKQRSAILDRAVQEANDEKNRILENAKNEIEAQKDKVKEELRSEVADLAIAGAEKILSQKVDAKSDKVLVQKILESL